MRTPPPDYADRGSTVAGGCARTVGAVVSFAPSARAAVRTTPIATELPIRDTGSIDDDLPALARGLVEWITSPAGRAVLAVMPTGPTGAPTPSDPVRHVFRDRIRRALPPVARAVARGELPPHTDPAELIKALVAPIYLRVAITGEKVDDRTADRAAAVALTAARAGLFTEDPSPRR